MRRSQLYPLVIALLVALGACRTTPEATSVDDPVPSIRLSDATESSGLTTFENVTGARGQFWFPETMGGGVALFDLDNDGDLDLAAATGGRWDGVRHNGVRVYQNTGTGRFEEVTDASGIEATNDYSMGFAVGDVNGDGWEDLFVTNVAGNRLYLNRDGALVDVTSESGLGDSDVWSTSAAFFDGDNDGDLDLLVGNYVAWSPENDLWCSNDGTDKTYCTPALYDGVSPSYYVNRGDGRFDNRTEMSGFSVSDGKTLGVVTLDFDRDGWTDVALANDTRADELFINNGDGTFDDIGLTAGFAYDERGRARAGMGVDATAYSQVSGSDPSTTAEQFQWSLAVGNFADEMIGVYRDVGNATLIDRSAALQVGHASLRTLTFGLLFSDVNLDGRDDLLAINGHIQPEIGRIRDNVTFRQPPHVFAWDGGQFRDVAGELDIDTPLVGRGLASGDIDGDGDLDYVVSENGAGLRLWQNGAISGEQPAADDGSAAFVALDLSRGGAPSSAIGTRVVVFDNGSSTEHTVRGGRSYLSAPSYDMVIGLGRSRTAGSTDGTVDSIRVHWPGGENELLIDVAVNMRHVVGSR